MRPADVPPELVAPARIPRLIRYALTEWAFIAVLWTLMSLSPWWLYPLGAVLVAGRLHALGVVLHDACHMSPRSARSGLWLLEILAGYPVATSVNAMRYHHLRHHRDSGLLQDPYFKPGISHDLGMRNLARLRGLLLVPAWILRGFYGSLALAVPALRQSYTRLFLQDRAAGPLGESPEVRQCLRREPRQALFFILVAALAWHDPLAVTLYYLAPLVLAGALNVNRVIVEHVHVACADRRPETIAATTVTHDWGALGRLFLFPRNIGFHVAHHLHPQAALECLPALERYISMRFQRKNMAWDSTPSASPASTSAK